MTTPITSVALLAAGWSPDAIGTWGREDVPVLLDQLPSGQWEWSSPYVPLSLPVESMEAVEDVVRRVQHTMAQPTPNEPDPEKVYYWICPVCGETTQADDLDRDEYQAEPCDVCARMEDR